MTTLIKDKGLKLTRQRELILDTIHLLQDEATINNICNAVEHEMDKSTVYRIIELFIQKGILTKELNYHNEAYFSIKEEHGHYFICIKCHKKEKLNVCPLKKIENDLTKEKGYKILNHKVEILGICNNCYEDSEKKGII